MMPIKPQRGVIYVLFNPSYPGTLKIGRTIRDAESRARELSRPSGVPQPFELVYDDVVSDVVAAEAEIHEILGDFRVSQRREFFRVKMRHAVRVVQKVASKYAVNSAEESDEIDILPMMEQRMRRWLRSDLVGLKFVQYSDLCLIKMIFQPDVSSLDAHETIFDLRVLAGDDDADEGMFDPFRRSISENVDRFVNELDPYSMMMVGIDIINKEADEYITRLVERENVGCLELPIFSTYRVSKLNYDIWGPKEEWLEMIKKIERSPRDS